MMKDAAMRAMMMMMTGIVGQVADGENPWEALVVDAVGACGLAGVMIIGLVVVIWAVLWTILPFYVMFISDRVKRMERVQMAEASQRAIAAQKHIEELRTQTAQLRAIVDALRK